MDKAHEGEEARDLAVELGFSTVAPPKSSRTEPWGHVMLIGFIVSALIVIAIEYR